VTVDPGNPIREAENRLMGDGFLFTDDGTLRAPSPRSEGLFAPCRPAAAPGQGAPPWRILVVDDDSEVHAITRYALRRMTFQERPLEILDAYSAAQAEEMLRANPDVALVLLDVVMETDDAGLRLVHRIRRTLGNATVRIVLRTGQPGQAPEERVIVDYDINDYKAKTELTAQKLFTTVVASLRAYADIMALEANRRGLRRIVDGSARLKDGASLADGAADLLVQLGHLLGAPPSGLVCMAALEPPAGFLSADCPSTNASSTDCTADPACAGRVGCRRRVLVNLDPFAGLGCPLAPRQTEALDQAASTGLSVYAETFLVLHVAVPDGPALLAWVPLLRPLGPVDQDLLDVFATKQAVALSNLLLLDRLRRANRDLRTLNEGLEQRVADRTRELTEANAKLERLASFDALTGILNRRRFMEIAAAERERSRRYGRVFAILLIDLDHFKLVNDTHGHAVGDTAIRLCAERTQQALRTTDLLARFGGEEFVVLLPETDGDSALGVAERVRQLIAATPMQHDQVQFSLTASIGIAALQDFTEPLAHVLERADRALYAAKQAGRNCVRQAGPLAA